MSRRRIRMRHLRTFLAIAESKSTTRAAEDLNTAQPNVSRTLREFEEVLGHQLFERVGRGLVLTSVGQTMLSYVLSGLEQVERGLDLIDAGRRESNLSVLITPSVSPSVAPGAVMRFKEIAPNVTLRIETTTSGDMIDRLRAGEVDFMIGRLSRPENMHGLSFDHLYSEPLSFVMRQGHPLAANVAHDFGDIARYPVLLPPNGPIIRDELDRLVALMM